MRRPLTEEAILAELEEVLAPGYTWDRKAKIATTMILVVALAVGSFHSVLVGSLIAMIPVVCMGASLMEASERYLDWVADHVRDTPVLHKRLHERREESKMLNQQANAFIVTRLLLKELNND